MASKRRPAIVISKSVADKQLTKSSGFARDVLLFDLDNCFPNNLELLIDNSGYTLSCVKMCAKYIAGNGFVDKTFFKTRINNAGEKVDSLLRKASFDYAKHATFAFHVKYNVAGKITEVYSVPVKYCRLGLPDTAGFINKIHVWDNWDKTNNLTGRVTAKPYVLDTFNPSPEVVRKQIIAAGGIEKYKGQIYYYSLTEGGYAKPLLFSVIQDVQTDCEIKNFRYKSVRNGFFAGGFIFVAGGFENDAEQQEFVNEVATFQGSENAGTIGVLPVPSGMDTAAVKFEQFTPQDTDKMFNLTTETCHSNIRKVFNIPPVLIGDLVAGKLGTADEIRDADVFYNNYTQPDRMVMGEEFQLIFENYYRDINPAKNYEIEKLTYL